MTYNLKKYLFILKLCFGVSISLITAPIYAQSAVGGSSELGQKTYSLREDLAPLKKYVSLDTKLSLEYRSDRLREMQNTETTNIRNLSILVNLFEDESSGFVFEILGEEDQVGNLNVNVGELYYHTRFSMFKNEDSKVQVGVLKLGYGILNDLDGLFAVLPSYYDYLYDLPRGLDTGVQVSTQLGIPELILSASVFAGKNLRQTDSKNRDIEVLPHHLKLDWSPTAFNRLGLNYFSRKYEAQPLVRGVGVEYQHMSLLSFMGINLDVDLELWSLSASINSVENTGLAALIAPKLTYKKVFFQPYVSIEQWGQDGTPDSRETFFTGKLGYNFNKHFQFVLEQTHIRNTTIDMEKENSLQARVVSQWSF